MDPRYHNMDTPCMDNFKPPNSFEIKLYHEPTPQTPKKDSQPDPQLYWAPRKRMPTQRSNEPIPGYVRRDLNQDWY